MAHRVCPWWLGYALINPLRRLVENPGVVLDGLVRDGMTVIEPGCGMGFFTLEIARRVGPSGRVVALDLQQRMLAGLQRRARRARLADRIEARLVTGHGLSLDDLAGAADLAVALHVVHEVPDQRAFFAELATALRAGGRVLVVEPAGHVTPADFAVSLAHAAASGLLPAPELPPARRLRAVLVRDPAVPGAGT
jgi:ubiquinone/menaquinone biosynthesis C-methylase UbiE